MRVIRWAYASWETLIARPAIPPHMSNWTDNIVGDRMAVDQEFTDRIRASEFNNQEWGLIMTAVEFEIEHADDPERARIVANTDGLPQIIPELEKVSNQVVPGGRPADDGGGGGGSGSGGGDGGVFGAIRGALGLGDATDDADRLDAAEELVDEYAVELQRHLESEGKWERVRTDYPD